MVNKLERDGMVAVLVSPGFGAGWSTWASDNAETVMFDPEMVELVLANKHEEARHLASQKYPEHYSGGVDDLIVKWVPKGTRFEIHEYDGSESLRILTPDTGFVA